MQGAGPSCTAPRGERLLLNVRVPVDHFAKDFVAALRRIRVLAVDASGLCKGWPHTFPQSTYERLERIATTRYGYKITPTFEITGEDPRPWPKREPGAFGPSTDRPESG